LFSGVEIYGGFGAGGGEWRDRDPEAYETVLSGDLNEDDEPGFVNYSDNSYRVVTGSGTDATARLDGFTITGGNANGFVTTDGGGGLYNYQGSPTIVRCLFVGNSANHGKLAGYIGGAMENRYSNAVIIDCEFVDNRSNYAGAMFNFYGNVKIYNSRFVRNASTTRDGGAMFNYFSYPEMVNCLFVDNSSTKGGAMYNRSSYPVIRNCTFGDNVARGTCGGIYSQLSSPTLVNCVLWGNTHGRIVDEAAQLYGAFTVNYSCVQGWTGLLGGVGNIGDDPLFKADGSMELAYGSRCVDAGNSKEAGVDGADLDGDGDIGEPIPVDLAGRQRYFDDPTQADTGAGGAPVIDMGAFERYEYCGDPTHPIAQSDLNRDCRVDLQDLALMAGEWMWDTRPE
jgi:hypothetical protein